MISIDNIRGVYMAERGKGRHPDGLFAELYAVTEVNIHLLHEPMVVGSGIGKVVGLCHYFYVDATALEAR
jgi:hypothetical protein